MKKCWMIGCGILAALAVFGEQFTLTIGGDGVTCDPAGGSYESGASVSVTAGAGFVKWLGDVPDGSENNAELTLTMNANKKLVPVYDGMWILDRSGATLTEMSLPREGHENFVLNVKDCDSANHTFTVGRAVASGQNARGNAFMVENGKIVGSGKLDLSTKIVDADGNEWTITKFRYQAFSFIEPYGALFTEFIAPRTLLSWEGQLFNDQGWNNKRINDVIWNAPAATNLVLDCPHFTGVMDGYFWTGCTILKSMTLKMPGLTKIQRSAFCGPTLADTDVSDWDLSGLKEIEGNLRAIPENSGYVDYSASGFFANRNCTGILRLPSIEIAGTNAFSGSKISEIYLGTFNNRSVKYVGPEAFANLWTVTKPELTWVQSTKIATKKIVIAGEEGWKLEAHALSLDGAISQIVFLGALPQALDAGESYFYPADDVAKKVCFYVNEFDEGAARILAGARELTSGEADAFMAANPGAAMPVGVIAPEVFGTANEQFVGKVDLAAYGYVADVKASVYDDRYGDSVQIEVEGGKQLNEAVPGDRITVCAVLNEGNRIGYWKGLPDDAVINGNEASFVLKDKPVDIRLRVQHKWRWLAKNTEENPTTTNRVTDGVWVLNVFNEGNSVTKRIKVGRDYRYGTVYTGIGAGILDLNGPVERDGDMGWSINEIAPASFKTHKDNNSNGSVAAPNIITEFIAPTNLVVSNLSDLMSNANSDSPSVLTNVILHIPEMAGSFGGWTFNGQSQLKTLTIYAPKATDFDDGAFNARGLDQDVSEWRLDSIRKIVNLRVSSAANLYGTLHLPSLTNVTTASGMANFKISALELGTKYKPKDQMPLILPATCFNNCPKLERLVLGPYANVSFESNTFAGLTALKEIVFLHKAFPRADIDKLLAGAKDWAVAIYGSPFCGWSMAALGLAVPTADDLTHLPADVDPALVTGLYTTASGKRAWIIRRASEWDPKGTVIIFR